MIYHPEPSQIVDCFFHARLKITPSVIPRWNSRHPVFSSLFFFLFSRSLVSRFVTSVFAWITCMKSFLSPLLDRVRWNSFNDRSDEEFPIYIFISMLGIPAIFTSGSIDSRNFFAIERLSTMNNHSFAFYNLSIIFTLFSRRLLKTGIIHSNPNRYSTCFLSVFSIIHVIFHELYIYIYIYIII